jgi:hypothetical protein
LNRKIQWTVAVPIALVALALLAVLILDLAEGGEAGSDGYLGEEKSQRFPYEAPTSTPIGAQPTARPTTATGPAIVPTTSAPGDPASRDAERRDDLLALAAAASELNEDEGSFPTTGGNVQTLCAYEQLDKGCAFRDVLSPLPLDPLGDPVKNGYWYSSDGESARFYASLEVEGTDADRCVTSDEELGKKKYVVCIQVP